MLEIYCIITGEVQQVSYRAYIQDAATELELVGWVRNMSDGTVEVLAQGSTEILKEFVEYLNEGSLRAKVEAVSVDWKTTGISLDEFSVRH